MLPASWFVLLIAVFAIYLGHEIAHVFAARALGFTVTELALGLRLGPRLRIATIGRTEVFVHLLPFGAYATIPDLEPSAQSSQTRKTTVRKRNME